MKSAIDEQSRLLPTLMFSNLVSKLVENGIMLLNYDVKDWRFKIVGLLILDRLLDVNIEIMAERRIEIVNQLRKVFEFEKLSLDTYAPVLQQAAVSIGHLARVASTTEIEYLQDYYVANAIRWLGDIRSETRRYAGAVLITELAINSPALIFVCRHAFFAAIWDVVFDKSERLRVSAAQALTTALTLVGEREPLGEYLSNCMNKVYAGFTINTPEKIHGSLLILECQMTRTVIYPEVFLETLKIMNVKLPEFFLSILQRKNSKDALVRAKIIELIPMLAALSPNTFINSKYNGTKTFLMHTVSFLLDSVSIKSKDRALAFISLGHLFVVVSPSAVGVAAIEMDIFKAIESGFAEPFSVEALQCLSMVVQVSHNSKRYITEKFATSMFKGGLTSDLIISLKEVSKHVASVRSFVRTRLRSLITNILLSHSIVLEPLPVSASPKITSVVLKTPSNRRGSLTAAPSVSPGPGGAQQGFFRDFFSGNTPSVTGLHIRRRLFGIGSQGASDISTDDEIILALQVLASFDFLSSREQLQLTEVSATGERSFGVRADSGNKSRTECAMLLRVVRDGVVRYLDDSNQNIRAAGAVTCAVVMDKVVKIVDADAEMEECLLQITGRLLMLGVGDDIAANRISVFSSLTPALDHVITASDCVNCLVDALNDESFDVRTAAMTVLSRVAHFDNVHVMPLARHNLSKIMQQLQDSQDPQMQLESVKMLRAMAIGMDSLIIPYIPLLLTPLLQLLSTQATSISCSALATVGELSQTSPSDVRPHLDVIFPALLRIIDSNTTLPDHLNEAMLALCNIASALGLVAQPYARYPKLFACLVKVIVKTDACYSSARLLAIRAIGLMGAVNSSLYSKSGVSGGVADVSDMTLYSDEKIEQKSKTAQGDPSLAVDGNEEDNDDKLVSLDKYYVRVVMHALTNILKDNSLATHHQTVMKVAMQIIKVLGNQGIGHLDGFIAALISRIYAAENQTVQDGLLQDVVVIMYVLQGGIIRHLSQLMRLTCKMLTIHVQICLDIIEALCALTPPQYYNGALREVLPLLMQIIRTELIQDSTDSTVGASISSGSGGIPSGGGNNEVTTRQSLSRSNSDAPAMQATRGPSGYLSMAVTGSGTRKQLNQTRMILKTLANIARCVRELSQQLIPIVISVMEDKMAAVDVRREALCVAMHLAMDANKLQEYAGRLIHPILRLLDSDAPTLMSSGFIALSTILCKIGSSFLPFVVTAMRKISVLRQRDGMISLPQMDEYESLLNRLLNQLPLPAEPSDSSLNFLKSNVRTKMLSDRAKGSSQSSTMNMAALKTAWTLSGRITSSDIVEWMRRLSIELIRQSPSPIIHPCAILAKVYQPLATELFNAAFVSVWTENFASNSSLIEFSDDFPLISSLETALNSPQIPDKIRTAILNLTEFLEMQGKQLPIDLLLLANQSQAANHFAKCLRYREIEFASKIITPSEECIEALITVNRQLDLRDAASGILEVVRTKYSDSITIQPRWLEKLHCWEEARLLYLTEPSIMKSSDSAETVIPRANIDRGLLRCMRSIGDHEELLVGATTLYNNLEVVAAKEYNKDIEESTEARMEVRRLGAHAAWMLGKWDLVDDFLGVSRPVASSSVVLGNKRSQSIDLENNTSFYLTVYAIHKRKYSKALDLINETRQDLAKNFSSLLTESYSRAYRAMISMQLLTEMEEIVNFNKYVSNVIVDYNSAKPNLDPSLGLTILINDELAADITERKAALMYKWRTRMQAAPREVDVLRQILNVHSLLLEPKEDLDSWLELVNLCMSNNMLTYCENILRVLGGPVISLSGTDTDTSVTHPRVLYHTYKFLWMKGERPKALSKLTEFLETMPTVPLESEARVMKVKCLLKKAEWMKSMMDTAVNASGEGVTGVIGASDILGMVREARDLATDQYSVWHAWAVTNFDQLQLTEANIASAVNNAAASDIQGDDLKERLRCMSIKDDLSERLKSADKRHSHRRSKSLSGFHFEDLRSIESSSTNLIIEAIKGFVRSILLGRDQPVANVLQDILRLLTLWFSYASRKNVFVVLDNELEAVPAESWLGVVPQLIARMHVKIPEVAGPLRKLLMKVSAAHPQALVCPISVAMNTTDEQRKYLASDIIHAVRKSNSRLVDDAAMVSKELMRVAITAHEFWHQGLERAAHLYIVEKDTNGMLQVLSQLHGLNGSKDSSAVVAVDSGNMPSSPVFSAQDIANDAHAGYTLRDLSFQNNFGVDLAKAKDWLFKFKAQRKNLFLLHQAWGIYYDVFKKIAAQLKNFQHVQLGHVSQALTQASSLCLAVPGMMIAYKSLIAYHLFIKIVL